MDIKKYFPERMHSILLSSIDEAMEIRLRVNRPLCVVIGNENRFLSDECGRQIIVSEREIDEIFKAVCEYSIYAYQREICESFITIEGGNRVGICGTAVVTDGKIEMAKHISGLNFRLSKEIIGCADEIYSGFMKKNPKSILIAGKPCCGKTTVLRDLCRLTGNKYRLSLIDERGEIAAVFRGIPQNDIGINTDVFDGYPKSEALLRAVRVMSPQVCAVDEIGSAADCEAIRSAACCGVSIIATAHAGSIDELMQRNGIGKLLNDGIFYASILLGEKGAVIDYRRTGGD